MNAYCLLQFTFPALKVAMCAAHTNLCASQWGEEVAARLDQWETSTGCRLLLLRQGTQLPTISVFHSNIHFCWDFQWVLISSDVSELRTNFVPSVLCQIFQLGSCLAAFADRVTSFVDLMSWWRAWNGGIEEKTTRSYIGGVVWVFVCVETVLVSWWSLTNLTKECDGMSRSKNTRFMCIEFLFQIMNS